MDELEQFKADRKDALLSLDKAKILAYLEKYDSPANATLTTTRDEIFWKAVHMAITGAMDLPIEFRRKSKAWLTERGLKSLDDGDL